MTDGATPEQRLQVLEDLHAIQRTLDRYTRAMDTKNPALLIDCFTEGGVWRSTVEGKYAGKAGMRLEGHAQLAEWLGARVPPVPGNLGRHLCLSPVIQLNGDEATVESYWCSLHETESGPLVSAFGRYIDRFERCSDENWRIRERHLARDSVQTSAQDKVIGEARLVRGGGAPERVR